MSRWKLVKGYLVGYNPGIPHLEVGYNPFTNHLLTSWDIQVAFARERYIIIENHKKD